jgi:hypothetical protein
MLGRGVIAGPIVFLFLATPASALDRFASPAGSGPPEAGGCPETNPCSLAHAIAGTAVSHVVDGDQVLLLPGDYDIGTTALNVVDAITIRPRDAGTRPLVQSTGTTAMLVQDAATVRDLEFESTVGSGTNASLFLIDAGALAERVVVRTTFASGNQFGCAVRFGTIRDSVCSLTATGNGGGAALIATPPVAAGDYTMNAVNVTAYAEVEPTATTAFAIAMQVESFDPDVHATLDGRNVIARGGSGVIAATQNDSGSTATLTLANSNFPTPSTIGSGTSFTPNTAPTNQAAPPLLADPDEGDFHQLTGSPTINAGAPDAQLGTLDVDFEARSQGPAPDIGADEFTETAPPPPPGGNPPDTKAPTVTITSKPKAKVRTRKKKAKFSVGFTADEAATFACSLDGKAATACTSPFTGKAKKGRHTVEVTATDAAGNPSAAAAASWKVKRKRKRRP